MKKLILSILLVCLSGCVVTAPITRENYDLKKEPARINPYLTGLIPGLSQFLNEEPVEGFIYSGIYLLAAATLPYLPSDNPSTPTITNIIMGAMMSSWVVGYIDGVYTTKKRHADWLAIKNQLDKEKYQEEMRLAEIEHQRKEEERQKRLREQEEKEAELKALREEEERQRLIREEEDRKRREEEERIRIARKIEEERQRVLKAEEERIQREKEKQELYDRWVERIFSEYPEEEALAICNGKILLGMSKDALIESWGYPLRTIKSVGPWGIKEDCYFPYSRIVYLENGFIVAWQE